MEEQTITAKGHTEGEWIVDKAATCTVDGKQHKECIVCHEVLKSETIVAEGHKESEWIIDQPATATTPGMQHKECTECGAFIGSEIIPATGSGNTSEDSNNTQSGNSNGGCGSMIAGLSAMPILLLGAAAYFVSKKRRN
jgi:hypothetical protein